MDLSAIAGNILSLLTAYWPQILLGVGTAVVASGVLEGIKLTVGKYRKANPELTKAGINLTLMFLTFVGSFLDYRLGLLGDAHPVAFLGISTLALTGLARTAYDLFLKSVSGWFGTQVSDTMEARRLIRQQLEQNATPEQQ